MEKQSRLGCISNHPIKFSLAMKLTTFLLLVSIFSVQSKTVSQNQKLTINLKNVKLIDVLDKIEKESKYTLLYNHNDIDLDRRVSIDVRNEPLKSILKMVFDGTNIEFFLRKEQIIFKLNKDSSSINETDISPSFEKVVNQQQIKVTGKVLDNNDMPLAGATIIEKGTNNGSVTNIDGVFDIMVNTRAILVISYVGYKTIEVPADGDSPMEILLEPSMSELEEIILVGYGTQQRKDVTGAIGGLNSEDIAKTNSTNVLTAMQGKVSGVSVISESGEPGAGINIRIRGANTLYGSTTPLFVIDGVQLDVNSSEVATSDLNTTASMDPLSNINPSDIESIQVLKDASATAIYGSRGANGVVIITTKSGKNTDDKGRLEYDSYYGVSTLTKKLDMLDADEYLAYQRERDANEKFLFSDENQDGTYDTPRDFSKVPSYDWQDEVFRLAPIQTHTVTASGSKGRTQYSSSLGLLFQEGIVKNNDYNRFNYRINLTNQLTEKLRITTVLNSSIYEQNGVTSNGGGGGGTNNGLTQYMLIANPWDLGSVDEAIENSIEDNFVRPIDLLTKSEKTIRFLRLIGNIQAQYNVTDNLFFIGQLGGNYSNSKLKEFYGSNVTWGRTWNGRAGIDQRETYSYNSSIQVHYKKRFNSIHRFDVMGASEISGYNFERFANRITNFADQSTGYNDISKGTIPIGYDTERWENNRLSYLGRLNYYLSDKYVFTLSGRIDGSDKFPKGEKYGFFPAAAFAWRINNEEFLRDSKTVSNLKLRLGWGVTGNERIPAYTYFSRLGNTAAAVDGGLVFGMYPAAINNPNLTWESKSQTNIGLDLGLFEDRVNLTVDAYHKKTEDMLVNIPISSQSGYNRQWRNVGSVENKGLEIAINTVNVNTDKFRWQTSFNISFNRNKVLDLGNNEYLPVTVSGGYLSNPGRIIVGQPIGIMYGLVFDGIYQLDDFTWQDGSDPNIPFEDRNFVLDDNVVGQAAYTPRPGDAKFKDLDGDNVITDEDRRVIGDGNPDFIGGLTNSFQIGNFDLNFFFNWSYGNDIFNAARYRLEGYQVSRNISREYYDNHWSVDNPTNKYVGYGRATNLESSYYIEDGSYLRLQNLNIGFTLPKEALKSLGLTNVRIYLSGNNLATWTNFKGFDPEISSPNALMTGYSRILYPRAKTYMIGLNLKF